MQDSKTSIMDTKEDASGGTKQSEEELGTGNESKESNELKEKECKSKVISNTVLCCLWNVTMYGK